MLTMRDITNIAWCEHESRLGTYGVWKVWQFLSQEARDHIKFKRPMSRFELWDFIDDVAYWEAEEFRLDSAYSTAEGQEDL